MSKKPLFWKEINAETTCKCIGSRPIAKGVDRTGKGTDNFVERAFCLRCNREVTNKDQIANFFEPAAERAFFRSQERA